MIAQALLPTIPPKIHHPATYTDVLIEIFAKHLRGYENVLDPMAGTGKLGNIKLHGYRGRVICNDLEDWGTNPRVDEFYHVDAARLPFADGSIASACVSPPYGTRMADAALNWSQNHDYRTYDRALGRPLQRGSTAAMQWGDAYRATQKEIWRECISVLKPRGLFLLNISDHIRAGKRVYVSKWHLDTLRALGLELERTHAVETPRLRFGANAEKRCVCEYVFVMRKGAQ